MRPPDTRRTLISASCRHSPSSYGSRTAITVSSVTTTIQSTGTSSVLLRSRTEMTVYRDWGELPFREIWNVDTEYYPGVGTSNGGREGDQNTPLCLVAHEMRSGRTVRLWQDELGLFPPYRLDADALFVGYMLT